MKNKLQEQLKTALKEKRQTTLNTLRLLLSAIQYEEMQKKVSDLSEEDSIAVIRRELNKRKEELDFAVQAGRLELKENLTKEIDIIANLLPEQFSEEKLTEILTTLKESGQAGSLGAAMKLLKEKHSGKYDSKLASDLAKKIFG
ncbi:MAG TPA: GatB/YqeY domain-containing protein [Oligoflexia bacterium]|nr:GatB/YqeY domain-containing protein [Oligoflexia bacterium]HMP26915.1 GatB/YqeY domain-containing protein [Oligoflexia bacterium]